MALHHGQRIHDWRKAKNWSIRELARRTGIHKSAIQRMENGLQDVRDGHLDKLVVALGISLPEFFTGPTEASCS